MPAFSRRLTAAFAAAFLLLAVSAVLAAPKSFIGSDDAKEKDEPQKFLPDYDKLVAGKDADWVYFPKGSLKTYKTVMVKDFENNGRSRDSRDAARDGKEYAEQWLEKEGFEVVEKNADLIVEGNVFNAWEPSGAARYWGSCGRRPRDRRSRTPSKTASKTCASPSPQGSSDRRLKALSLFCSRG